MGLKDTLQSALPAPVYARIKRVWLGLFRVKFFMRLVTSAVLDSIAYFKWSHDGRTTRRQEQERSAIIKAYHGIEKGLSLQAPRPGFGQDRIKALVAKIDAYTAMHPTDHSVDAAIDSIRQYAEFNATHNITFAWLDAWLRASEQKPGLAGEAGAKLGGTLRMSRDAVHAASKGVGASFFESRHSMRQFGPDRIPEGDIQKAVQMAQKSPSVCNRQGPRVHCFPDAVFALRHQPGNAGFGHLASHGLVITSDLQAFSDSGERHQAYVDGGIFAMSLAHAFHALGYGSCMLAWNKSPAEEAATKRALSIPESQVIVMMMAVGTLPDAFDVAVSWRRPLQDVLKIHVTREPLVPNG